MTITFAQLEQAKAVLSKQIVDTPTIESPRLAQLTNLKKLYLKLDLYQYTGSFKDRGTLNKLANLTPEQAKNGVIAMSAGNHAQGLAYHAKRMGIPTTIVMPQATPFNKIERTRNLGARVLLHGTSLDVAADYARQVAKKENLTFVHPYDDPLIIAGQGTLGLELLDKVKDLDIVVVPVGGGGLIAGVALAVKTLNPAIEVIGVQTKSYPAVYNAFYQTTGSSQGSTIAEGIAVPSPGGHTLPLIKELVKDVLLVEENMLERAIELLVIQQKIVSEGAGAAGLAGILAYPQIFAGKNVATTICGGNIDPRLLSQILMRGMLRDGRLVTLRVEIQDQPGVLAKVAGLIGEHGGNIIEIHHQRMFSDLPVKSADVDVVIETRNAGHIQQIRNALNEGGFPTRRLSSRSDDSDTESEDARKK